MMRGDPVSITLDNPSAREIRNTKLEMWADWEALNEMPGEVVVRRGHDMMKDCRFATIIVRSTIPRTMKWNG
jgi:hypothetical protein